MLPRSRGRPRAFDSDLALEKAAETFWRLGYEGASITDLTAAMGITPQSLYAAFSSKAELYRQALAWYLTNVLALPVRALEETDLTAALTGMLRGSAQVFTQAGRPRGCMISTAILTCASENEAIARHVSDLRNGMVAALKVRIERGIADGQLRPSTDAGALARFVGAMIQGMSVQAQDGASQGELLAIGDHAAAEIGRHRM
jgi:AcrR family transcriptional regulator